MGFVVFFVATVAMVAVWRSVARGLAYQGRGWYLRNVIGGTAGGFVWLVAIVAGAAMGAFSTETPSTTPDSDTPPVAHLKSLPAPPATTNGQLLDGELPYGIETMFKSESPSIHHGVLTIYVAGDIGVSAEILRSRVGMLCMARWSAPDVLDEDGELSPPTLSSPAWAGITRVRVLDRHGINGLAFTGGDADCDAMPDHDQAGERAYIDARTVPASAGDA